MNTEVTAEELRALGADAIILATGSVPVMPRSIPGIDHPKTISGVDACMNKRPVGKKVVIVGGGLVGCEIAYGYAKEGKQVAVVEALDDILMVNDVPAMNKLMLVDAFEYYGTRVLTGTRLKEVNDKGAVVEKKDGTVETVEADTVIMSIGYRSVPSMAAQLSGCGAEIYEIGDGNRVGNVLTCIQDACSSRGRVRRLWRLRNTLPLRRCHPGKHEKSCKGIWILIIETNQQEVFEMKKDVMIVTGAGQIGMAIARRVGFGKKIILGDKSMKNAEAIAKIMNDAGYDVVPFEMDLSSRAYGSQELYERL